MFGMDSAGFFARLCREKSSFVLKIHVLSFNRCIIQGD